MLLNTITVVLGQNEIAEEVIRQHFRPFLGDGKNINSWSEDYIGRGQLGEIFSRIFVLVCSRASPVANYFGRWDSGRWKWKVALRRRLFDWKLEM